MTRSVAAQAPGAGRGRTRKGSGKTGQSVRGVGLKAPYLSETLPPALQMKLAVSDPACFDRSPSGFFEFE